MQGIMNKNQKTQVATVKKNLPRGHQMLNTLLYYRGKFDEGAAGFDDGGGGVSAPNGLLCVANSVASSRLRTGFEFRFASASCSCAKRNLSNSSARRKATARCCSSQIVPRSNSAIVECPAASAA